MKTLATLALVVAGSVAAIGAYDYATGGGIGILPPTWIEQSPSQPTASKRPSCSHCCPLARLSHCSKGNTPANASSMADEPDDDFPGDTPALPAKKK